MSVAFIFPGQGSQDVGMGAELAKAFPSAKRVFDEVDEALGDEYGCTKRQRGDRESSGDGAGHKAYANHA